MSIDDDLNNRAMSHRLSLATFPIHPHSIRAATFANRPSKSQRFITTMSRTYPEALRLLSEIQSNLQITSLFDKSSGSGSKSSTKDLDSLSLPESRDALRRAGYTPEDLNKLRHIHVAGTKGKGSVCAFATGILKKYGKVGTYTSPHLLSVRERIAINGEPISQEKFAESFFEVWDRFTEAAKRDGMDPKEAEGPRSKPFFFRFLTVLAWHVFLKEKVESVVLEVGIGGEYDVTNIVLPEAVSAAVVTQLGIDHVAMLGDTVEKITWHKAGIFKPGVRGFVRRLDKQPSVMEVLRDRAAEKGTELVGMDDTLVEQWGGVQGQLVGDFQKYNQALAVLAVRQHLGMESNPATALQDLPQKMVEGLREARLRGRCEVIHDGNIDWYLDGAHTKDSLEQVAKWFTSNVGAEETPLLVFNQQERNATELLDALLKAVQESTARDSLFSHGLFTRNEIERVAEGETRDTEVQAQAARLMGIRVQGCQTATFSNLRETIEEARRIAGERGTTCKVLVTGSLYLVGGILRALEPESLL